MALDFISPSMRAAGSDLTISVSPLGLIELSDEEFEVHGPRLTRYANAAAFYLGHHWAYRRPPGEPQVTMNYVAAFSDYLTNFTFGKTVMFQVDPMFTHITPALLDRIWDQDNSKDELMWGIGNLGSVYGDAFVKVAYEPAWENTATGEIERGRVRILPMNPSFCLPDDTEILTRRGWLTYDQLTTEDEAASMDPATHKIVWSPVEHVNVFDWDGPLAKWQNERFDVMSTPDHRWLYRDGRGKEKILRTHELHDLKHNGGRLVVGGGESHLFAEEATYDDNLVRLAGWFVTEGHWHENGAPMLTQSSEVYPENAAEIAALLYRWNASHYVYEGKADQWYAPNLRRMMLEMVGPDKRFGIEFLKKLTVEQAEILFETLIKGDGNVRRDTNTTTFAQSDPGRVDDFQTLCMMLGKRTNVRWRQREIGRPTADITVYGNDTVNLTNLERTEEQYTGKVWCPTTGTGMWIARRKGTTFHTGNCFPEWHPHDKDRLIRFKLKYRFWSTAPEGTRMVNTYVEILTDQYIEEYINDELIDRRPNPLGFIPIAHIANKPVAASPWGLSDVQDVIPLNRTYNELATDILDIINYHVAPVTIITGSKASNLEMGANKVWALPNKDARVENLSGGADGLAPAIQFMDILKLSMHELMGVPQNAMGAEQQISNTSGVALAIQYMPTMLKYNLKKIQYGNGIKKISQMALKTLLFFEPDQAVYNPDTDGIMQDGQPPMIDWMDPAVYQIKTLFPPPLPQDQLVVLNEIMTELELGLESKQGALRKLGEQFPDEKLQELFTEQLQDTKMAGAQRILDAQINAAIMALTGIVPEGAGTPVGDASTEETTTTKADGTKQTKTKETTPTTGLSSQMAGVGDIAGMVQGSQGQLMTDLVTQAFGTKLPQRRLPSSNDNEPGYG